MNKADHARISNSARALMPSSAISWDKLRDLIQETKELFREHNITMYSESLKSYEELTWRGSGNGSKVNFYHCERRIGEHPPALFR